MKNNTFETLVGAVVIAVAAFFIFYAYSTTDTGAVVGGYEVLARFNRVDGVNVGSDVRMSGIKVGTVSKLDLDPKTFNAVAHLSIAQNVKLPDDSAIRVTSSGLLSSSYFSIEPGGSDKNIAPGGEITNTQGAIDLMGLLGKFMFSSGSSSSGSNSQSGTPPPAPQPSGAGKQ